MAAKRCLADSFRFHRESSTDRFERDEARVPLAREVNLYTKVISSLNSRLREAIPNVSHFVIRRFNATRERER